MMKAARFHKAQDVRIDEIPIPEVKPGYVRIRPAYCGICGSDLHEYEDGPHIIPQPGSKHALTGEGVPVVMGHEFSGVIDKIGEGVTGFREGQKAAIQPILFDEDCLNCGQGLPNCCDQFGFIGLSGGGGGMSEYTCVPATAVKPLPDDFPLDIGALVEPLAVGWHAVAVSPYKDGDNVLVSPLLVTDFARGSQVSRCSEAGRLGWRWSSP
jgi:threonine dehydrogenase-like Zn-dependent dehydrogenase